MTMDIFQKICSLAATDRGGRSASLLLEPGHLSNALSLLETSRNPVIITGFFILACGAAETDGPGGASVLSRALLRSGRRARLCSDPLCTGVLSACSASVGGPLVETVTSPEEILQEDTDLVVFIERLGRASDGRYYNMRGEDVSAAAVPLDGAAILARKRGIPVLGIGDGGNEAGLGIFREALSRLMPGYGRCLSVIEADAAIPVDISDWGGYALAGLLSLPAGKWLGAEEEEVDAMLRALVAAGAVDGVNRRRAPTVDGFPAEDHRRFIGLLKEEIMPLVRISG